ncbi:MAG: DUF1569 domain-containing protein [Phycisphaerales bacterium]
MAQRRKLQFHTMQEILRDVEELGAVTSETGESICADGNWTPAQIVEHVTFFIDGTIDGFDFTAPLLIRVLARPFKKRILTKPMKPGVKLPARMNVLLPDPETTWDDAVSALRDTVARIDSGERMMQPSPLLGAMTHEDWVNLHCRHAEMHFSFMHAD